MIGPAIIAHENQIMLSGITSLVQQVHSFETVPCATAEQTIASCKEKNPVLVIASFTIPSMGALQLIKRIKGLNPTTSIIIAASQTSGYIAEKCIQNGAHGYVTSNIDSAEFGQAIDTVLNKDIFTESIVSQRLALQKITGAENIVEKLSPREFDIFSRVILDKTAKEVAEELFLAEKTVANYISIIKKKLKAKTGAGLLRIGLKEGYIENPQIN